MGALYVGLTPIAMRQLPYTVRPLANPNLTLILTLTLTQTPSLPSRHSHRHKAPHIVTWLSPIRASKLVTYETFALTLTLTLTLALTLYPHPIQVVVDLSCGSGLMSRRLCASGRYRRVLGLRVRVSSELELAQG